MTTSRGRLEVKKRIHPILCTFCMGCMWAKDEWREKCWTSKDEDRKRHAVREWNGNGKGGKKYCVESNHFIFHRNGKKRRGDSRREQKWGEKKRKFGCKWEIKRLWFIGPKFLINKIKIYVTSRTQFAWFSCFLHSRGLGARGGKVISGMVFAW